MTRLTMTQAIVKAIDFLEEKNIQLSAPDTEGEHPTLKNPTIGKPISHGQVITISRQLREYFYGGSEESLSRNNTSIKHHLDDLLRGSRLYVEPLKPKTEPVGVNSPSNYLN